MESAKPSTSSCLIGADSTSPPVSKCLTAYFRCPDRFARLAVPADAASTPGFFQFGPETTCFGRCTGAAPSPTPDGPLPDIAGQIALHDGTLSLPFDPCEVIGNLHHEAYVGEWRSGSASVLAALYYFVRPLLSVSVRKHLQKLHFRNWEKIPFPRWPVDSSVDNLLRQLLLCSLRQSRAEAIPFIWFWPARYSACALMTHDIETQTGRDFCSTLMDIDESWGIPASMQVVPEERYNVTPDFLDSLRSRGFEVVVHDLNHDGHLYRDRKEFLRRAARINAYLREYQADGFRAAVLYRKQVWYDALQCSFDMSVPNVARLDPQRGGCCTVMPYFLGDIVELPVTTIQDYTLFNILNDYSIDIWKQQIDAIREKNGLMSFIVHPDYVMDPVSREVYELLLSHLAALRKEQNVWITLPGELNRWWRQRAAMRIVETPDGWRIEGAGSDRACLAWASEHNGQLAFSPDPPPSGHFSPDASSHKAGMFS
ncbi:MAG TPA: hypothetical protein VHX37_10340 [Acidobacteriaceae bacterium]|jgi:hypothetical protein|nr:hypothetical protein [Acidobacteriaceae bacterium]